MELMDEIWSSVVESPGQSLLYGMAILACCYTLLAIFCLRRFPRRPAPVSARKTPGVTILKPLYGAEEDLFENLASFCRQTYAGPVQILFGVHDADDAATAAAVKIVNALRAGQIAGAPAGLTAKLVVDGTRHGANGKVS